MAEFQVPEDIVNRGLQLIGVPRVASLSDMSCGGVEAGFIYDKVRLAELNRNLWTFATRTVVLRALDTTSSKITFEAWASGTTYAAGYVVTYGNMTWVSTIGGNLGNTPGADVSFGQQAWQPYFGQRVANMWNDSLLNPSTSINISYHAGEVAYLLSSGNVYVSAVEGNQNEPDLVDVWSSTIMYSTGDVASFNGVNYQSRVDRNFNFEPDISATQWTSTVTNPLVSRSWVQLTGASVSQLAIIYPVTAGPVNDTRTNNAFYLPAGFLRRAPADPKSGAAMWLGTHARQPFDDLMIQNPFVIARGFYSSAIVNSLMMRFIADVTDVSTFEPLFCEGLAARFAMDVAPTLRSDKPTEHFKLAQARYREVMSDARTVNAIEVGTVEPPEDDYIRVRY